MIMYRYTNTEYDRFFDCICFQLLFFYLLVKNADLHTGYFCYNCVYFIKDTHCAIVEDTGPDVRGEESAVIAPHGVCTLWVPNEEEAR